MSDLQNTITLLLKKAAELYQKEFYTEALQTCEQAIRLNPLLASARTNRGIVLKKLGRYSEALLAYDRSLMLNPSASGTHYNRGLVLQELDRWQDAVEAYNKAIQLDPEYVEAYSAIGVALKHLGHYNEAAEAFKQALRRNPDLVNEQYYLACLGNAETPSQAPDQYIIELFDNYASSFDTELVDKLEYRAPQQIYEAIHTYISDQFETLEILDLGCGTGLCGVLVAKHARQLVGIDLSQNMLAKARAREIYTDLIQSDLLASLNNHQAKYDIIISADVFIYIGDLAEIFHKASRLLHTNGFFAFSIETTSKEVEYEINATGRYSQSLKYIQKLADNNNLQIIENQSVILRRQEYHPVEGAIIVMQKSPR